jgi:hypothetical protein
MKTISVTQLTSLRSYLWQNCSRLLQAQFRHAFENADPQGIFSALLDYQNADGGFGHNLEGDFELPDSSPMATSVAFQLLTRFNAPSDSPLVQGGIQYLVNSYQPDRPGWITVPRQVNDYPHASWWHYHADMGGAVIDQNWGNPTAELTGYFLRYPELSPRPVREHLLEQAMTRLFALNQMEMHELFCFLRLAENIPPAEQPPIQEKLAELVQSTVETDPQKWLGYSAQPLDFVKSPGSFLVPVLQEHIPPNLDFWIAQLEQDGFFSPPWNWEGYESAWQVARKEIVGRMMVERFIVLKEFGRIS